MKRAISVTLVAVSLVSVERMAAAATFELGGDVLIELNAGADPVLNLTFDDGTTQDISGGNGVSLAVGGGGIFFDDQQHQLEIVLTAGVKYSTMKPTENAGIDWVRIPLEAMAFYRNDALHFRAGLGETLYAFNSLQGSGAISDLDVKFAPALGTVIQADFLWKKLFIGLRYTILSIRPTSSDQSISANSIGLDVGFFHSFGGG